MSAMEHFHQGDYQRATIKFRQLIDYDKTDARAWNGLGMCQVRLHDYHEAHASFLNAIRFDPDNQIYLKNLHELMVTYLNDDDRKTESPVPVTGKINRNDIFRFIRNAPCLCIGCILLIMYASLLLLDMAAIYPTVHIIGVCGLIFILFYIDTSLLKYLTRMGVKNAHLFAIFILFAGMVCLMILLITLPGPGPATTPANLQKIQPSPLITPYMPATAVQTSHQIPAAMPDPGKERNPSDSFGIQCTKPDASFEYEVISTDPYQVRFYLAHNGTPSVPVEMVWDFGSRTNGTGIEPNLESPGFSGAYMVNLTIRNECGETDSAIRTIEPVNKSIRL